MRVALRAPSTAGVVAGVGRAVFVVDMAAGVCTMAPSNWAVMSFGSGLMSIDIEGLSLVVFVGDLDVFSVCTGESKAVEGSTSIASTSIDEIDILCGAMGAIGVRGSDPC